MENTVDAEAIRNAINAVLPSLRLNCDMVPCRDEIPLFSSSFEAVFRSFFLFLQAIAFLVSLDGFHPLMRNQLTADLTLECSNGSMFHALSDTKSFLLH